MKVSALLFVLIVLGISTSAAFADGQRDAAEKLKPLLFQLCGNSKPFDEIKFHHFKAAYTTAGPPVDWMLMKYPCGTGAYNFSQAWVLVDPYNEAKLLSFARPQLNITYEDEDQTALKSMTIASYSSSVMLVNSIFDPKTLTISEFNKWRGLADASSSGEWVFKAGKFVLQEYRVDPTYDSKIEPETVVQFDE